MSRKNNKGQGTSGFLTGLVIVSTGLIAGFQGFDLVMKNSADRSPEDVAQQVSALDQMVTASLEEGSNIDRDGLATLVRTAQTGYPMINRAEKTDRAAPLRLASRPRVKTVRTIPVISRKEDAAVEAFAQFKRNDAVAPAPTVAATVALNAEREVAQLQKASPSASVSTSGSAPVESAPVVQASLASEVPYADSADIALFAADMPLPAKLTAPSYGAPASSGARGDAPYRSGSALVPRKFPSGKAFGGLGERDFQRRERRCMTTALYFEARSEPEIGQIAVGQTIMNRIKSPDYPDTICGVVYQGSHRRTGCQFSFTCDGKPDKPNNRAQWERSKRLANDVLEGRVWLKSIGSATHYHATYVKPRWRRQMIRLKQIGRHIFYKAPEVSVTATYQRYVSGQRS